MPETRDDIPPGTLYLLILKTLARHGELHGFEIANSILQTTEDVLQVEEGSLYPALQRTFSSRDGSPQSGVRRPATGAPATTNSPPPDANNSSSKSISLNG